MKSRVLILLNALSSLKKESKILLTGPTAHLISYLNGGWSYSQNNNDEFYEKFGRKLSKTRAFLVQLVVK